MTRCTKGEWMSKLRSLIKSRDEYSKKRKRDVKEIWLRWSKQKGGDRKQKRSTGRRWGQWERIKKECKKSCRKSKSKRRQKKRRKGWGRRRSCATVGLPRLIWRNIMQIRIKSSRINGRSMEVAGTLDGTDYSKWGCFVHDVISACNNLLISTYATIQRAQTWFAAHAFAKLTEILRHPAKRVRDVTPSHQGRKDRQVSKPRLQKEKQRHTHSHVLTFMTVYLASSTLKWRW